MIDIMKMNMKMDMGITDFKKGKNSPLIKSKSRYMKSNNIMSYLLSIIIMSILTISAWNMRSLGPAGPYLHELADLHKSDVICISEHRLYPYELFKLNDLCPQFDVHAKSSEDLSNEVQTKQSGHCGIGILWRKELSNRVKVVECESDRLCVIEIAGICNDRSVFVISTYLPQQQCRITSFTKHLEILSDLIEKCKLTGEVIIMGDLNSHFGPEIGNRFYGKTTKNAKLLNHLINNSELEILDKDHDRCSGPCYTFYVDGVGKSYVDHCIATRLMDLKMHSCCVIEDSPTNTSDHLALKIQFQVSYSTNKSSTSRKQSVAWKRLSAEEIDAKYTTILADKISPINDAIEALNVEKHKPYKDIDKIVNDLVEKINTCCSSLPHYTFKKHLKPYWNNTLTALSKERKEALRLLRNANVSETPNARQRYKQIKNLFRKAIMEAKIKYEEKNMEELQMSNDIDVAFFWKLVNKGKTQPKTVHPLKVGGRVITDEEEIRIAWHEYFNKLYSPGDDRYDAEFTRHIEEEIEKYKKDANLLWDDILKNEFTTEEVGKVIDEIKHRKAPGWDNISGESIKYGKLPLTITLTKLFNLITRVEYIPIHFKIGQIITIPKINKDKSNQDNYRGITLLPVIAK